MKTILFMIRFIMNPFKVTNSMIFNKGRKDNAILKTIKTCCKVVFSIIGFVLLAVILSEDKNKLGNLFGSVKFDYSVSVYKKENDDEGTNQLLPSNPDGSVNGLNLQLIDQIATEGYVKEYLSVLRDFQLGKFTSNGLGMDMDVVLGISHSESGFYDNTVLPKTFLPWDSSSGSPLWKNGKGLVPDDAVTIRQANSNVLKHYTGIGSGPIQSLDLAIGAVGKDNSWGPFQINHLADAGYDWKKAIVNGYKANSNREFDPLFYIDNLAVLSSRFDKVKSYFNEEDWNSLSTKQQFALYSVDYNPGIGILAADYLNGVSFSDMDGVKAQIDIVLDDLQYIDVKYGDYLESMSTPGNQEAFIGLALINERGWQYATNTGQPSRFDMYGGYYCDKVGSSLDSILSGKVNNKYFYTRGKIDNLSYVSLVKEINGRVVRIDTISLNHQWMYTYAGARLYAKILKYAGVNVDPTNPNSYMNTLPEGEWKPSGDSVWMSGEKVDMKKLDKDGEKILNEGKKYIGLPYIFGGNDPNTGLDCSSFVQWTYRRSMGIELPRVTYDQARLGREVSISEAKPGDLVFYYTTNRNDPANCEHVAIFLGMDGDQPRIMHAPYPGEFIKFATWDGRGSYGYNDWAIRRLN